MRIVLSIILCALAIYVAVAQEAYTLNASAGNVTTLTGVITKRNGDLCASYGQARTCSQATMCTLASVAGGASCTAAAARTAGVRIYPLTLSGREEFTTYQIALPKFVEIVGEQDAETRRSFCEFWLAANTTARNSACSAIGASAGCDPVCP
jgi:hypothetical protein